MVIEVPERGRPETTMSVQIFHPFIFVVALGVVVPRFPDVVDRDADPAGLQHLHGHRGPGAGEAGDDDERLPEPGSPVYPSQIRGHGGCCRRPEPIRWLVATQ